MLKNLLFASALLAILNQSPLAIRAEQTPTHGRMVRSLDADWRFCQGAAQGAEQPQYDDALWRQLDVPHDWSIAGTFDEDNPAGGDGGFLPTGIGWYRKEFTLPAGSYLISFVAA